MGGAVRIEGDDCEPIEAPNLPFVVGFDGGAGDTGELVAGVGELREEYGFAADTVESIGDVVRTGEKLPPTPFSRPIRRRSTRWGGAWTSITGCSALGVSARSLDAMVRRPRCWRPRREAHRRGGGGCIVALDASDASETAFSSRTGARRFRAELATEGVRVVEP